MNPALVGKIRRLLYVLSTMLLASSAPASDVRVHAPTTAPGRVATSQPTVTSAARELLAQVREAYAKLDSVELAGTIAFDFDAAGRHDSRKAEFAAYYEKPGKLRHEVSGDVLVVSTGQKLYVHLIERNRYTASDAPSSPHDAPAGAAGQILAEQNPSLLLAAGADAEKLVIEGAQNVERVDDVFIDSVAHPTLRLVQSDRDIRFAFDPVTHLLREAQFDLRKLLDAQAVPAIRNATVTISYSKSVAGAAVDPARFAWTPPANATLTKPAADGELDLLNEEGDAQQLVGKPAPAFTLQDLDGKPVSLADLTGSVVVLDFWATWCPPCREGLPHLDKLHKGSVDRGVRVLAVNLREEKSKAQAFLAERGLSLTVLMDPDGSVAREYRVQGIPQTVVIGKGGAVQKVFVGFGPGSAESLSAAVEAALRAE